MLDPTQASPETLSITLSTPFVFLAKTNKRPIIDDLENKTESSPNPK